MRAKFQRSNFLLGCVMFTAICTGGCSAEASQKGGAAEFQAAALQNQPAEAAPKGPTIRIEPNSPADTVRAFYESLREKRFREAIFLTNLRPAVEGLTDSELKEFQVDFEAIAQQIPSALEINGEITTGDNATVTAKLPNLDSEKSEIQEIRLRRENGVWVILTVDEAAEKLIKKEGKNYFNALRIKTHEDEAREMMDRIAKAQLAHSAQNGGTYADVATLVSAGLLPEDIRSAESTGYNYAVEVSADKKQYSANATPAVYGKSGRRSFAFKADGKGVPLLHSGDNGGKPFKK